MTAVTSSGYDRSVYEQSRRLVDRIEDYLGGWHPPVWRREMELFDAVVATLFYYKHDCAVTDSECRKKFVGSQYAFARCRRA
jgi:hypothetical protein